MNEHIADQRHLALVARIKDLEEWRRLSDTAMQLLAERVQVLEHDSRLITESAVDVVTIINMDKEEARTWLLQLEQQLHDLTVKVGQLIESHGQ